MRYNNIVSGKFIRRPNRFIAEVEIDGTPQAVHVKNTGRLRELLIPGNNVYLEDHSDHMGSRKMRYSLIACDKGEDGDEICINIDSQAPNKVVKEALESGKLRLPGMDELTILRPEMKYKDSRFDFYLEDVSGSRAFMEVKGVTLMNDGHASFPDAPTVRGARHVRELKEALLEGYKAYVLFVLQMRPVKDIMPNEEHDPEFSKALREAFKAGVGVLAYDCLVTPDTLILNKEVKVVL